MSCGVGCRGGSDPTLLWHTALIRPLAWEPPYAEGAAQEMAKRQKTKNKTKKTDVQLNKTKSNQTIQKTLTQRGWKILWHKHIL